jgi:thiol-disulfide isomerase/thioredoxin
MLRCLMLVSLLLLAPAAIRADEPPIFDKRPYAQAKKAAADSGKWLIVKGTAVWCGPCKQMDNTTWRNDRVESWLKDRAIVVAVDVDKEPNVAQELGISAMPTMIAFKQGKAEAARVVGYQGPEVTPRPGRPGQEPASAADVDSRYAKARELASGGKDEEAAEEYEWLWLNALEHKPSMAKARTTTMAAEMTELAARNPGAKQTFTDLRNKLTAAAEAEPPNRDAALDWLVLNRIIGDMEQTLAWFNNVKDQPQWRAHLDSLGSELESGLVENNRWADLGKLYQVPVFAMEKEHEVLKMMVRSGPPKELTAEQRREFVPRAFAAFHERNGRRYAALLAAERDEEAGKFAEKARQLEPKPAMVREMVASALKAGEAREEHLPWVQKIKGRDRAAVQLEADLKKALGK